MNNLVKKFLDEFELYIGAVFLSITAVVVITNVITRYFLNFTYQWAEEVAVGAFVWVIFLGFANAFRTQSIIGVEILVKVLPEKARHIVEVITSLILTLLSGIMFYLSYIYVEESTKITAALEVSYKYIYASMVISFGLIFIYSIFFIVKNIKALISDRKVESEEK